MTVSINFLFLSTLLLFISLSVSALPPYFPSPVIGQACRATRYPDACQSMVSATGQIGPRAKPSEVINAAFLASAKNLNTARRMVQGILDSSAQNLNRSRAAKTCLEGLSYSKFRTIAAHNAIAHKRLRDARAWVSAALSYQYGCWSGLKYVNDSAAVNSTMSFLNTTLIVSTSNALSMLQALDALGPNPATWTPPRTERDGLWEPVIGSGSVVPGFNFSALAVDATVCNDGSGGCYKTVQEAVDAAPVNLKGGKRFVIKIKEGVYKETVRVAYKKTNLVFIGDGMGKTVITGFLNAGMQGVGTYESATVGVIGDGFMASGITFENTAPGPDTHQAVAFRSSSDFSYIENCEFLGNQDTLYVHSLRQLYKSCHIEGNVDFIFGNAAAIFQDCTILVRPRQATPDKGEKNAIAAHGRTDPAQTTGLVFIGCLINGTNDYMQLYRAKPSVHLNYLGRPWKMYSRTVYINCTMESLISDEGWTPWDGDFALSTLYYGEFGNAGDGAGLSKRVSWSKPIPEEHVSTYYVRNFLQGDEWITAAAA
ncbi:hypothetical protein KSS87_006773 [Heliosperma pusillum]|nr:hypothetical protein KSS87_006773 [Heliosperma pusillum]